MTKILHKALLFFMILCAFVGQTPITGETEKPAVPTDRDQLSIEKIISDYINACGGQAVAEIARETRKGTLVRGSSGQVPLETVAKDPGKWYYNQTFAFGDQVSYICDGSSAWVQDTGGVGEMSAAERLDLKLLLDVQAPLKLREFFPAMTIQGTAKAGDTELIIVRAKSLEGITAELHFDTTSGLLIRAGDIHFEDYRTVGKVKRPFRILFGEKPAADPLALKMEFSEIRHDLEVEDSLFERPVCSLPSKDAPLWKIKKEVKINGEALDACLGVYQHPDDPKATYTVTRQGEHLMIERTGWGTRLEIKPESETDFFVRFLRWEFHFVKDASGQVTALEIGADRTLKAKRIIPQ